MKALKIHTLILFISFIFCFSGIGQVKETLSYATKNGQVLHLDKYQPKTTSKNAPCIIFMFGGSFRGGERNNKAYTNYFDYFAQQGYTVISIDYRLGLKNIQPANMQEVVGALKNAIDIAVEDLYDATNFVIRHAREWSINPEKIIISGSSAGAIAVLQAEYERCNNTKLAAQLPKDFRYAGVIAFAGAVLAIDNSLKWQRKPAPMLLFHGDTDSTVPFAKLAVDQMSFCGSQDIAMQLHQLGSPYCLYQFNGAAHEIANTPMRNNLPEIERFLNLMVIDNQNLMLQVKVEKPGQKKPGQPLTLEDFIKNNFK